MQWINKNLFRKLLIGMLLAAVVPFLLSNLIAYQTTSSSIKKQVIDLNHNAMDIIANHLELYFQELSAISSSFYVDTQLMGYFRLKETTPLQTLYIASKVNAMYISRPELHAVRFISHVKNEAFTSSDVSNSDMSQLLLTASEITEEATQYHIQHLGNKPVLQLQKNVIDFPSAATLGTLNVYISLNEISKLIHSQLMEKESYFLYINQSQELLYSASPDIETMDGQIQQQFTKERGSFEEEAGQQRGVFIYVQNDNSHLPFTLVKFVPDEVIYQSAYKTLSSTMKIQFIAIAFVVVFALMLSYVITRPIKRLIQNMGQVGKGRFDIPKGKPRTDELGLLEARFYGMTRNLDDLMNREYRYRLELSTAQLKMLQAQINPHFLYNTMQSIGTVAMKHGIDEISDRISELGSILRYSMDFQTEVVPLELELEHIADYMSLQISRFKNKITFSQSCSPEARRLEVPKMLLQPLIENSIVHGMEKGRGTGWIHLDIEWQTEASVEMLRIQVIDNGKGISAETIETINQDYRKDSLHYGKSGIGLINVLQRLRLVYGDGFSWEITSVPFEATVIALSIRMEKHPEEEAR